MESERFDEFQLEIQAILKVSFSEFQTKFGYDWMSQEVGKQVSKWVITFNLKIPYF